MSVMLNWQGLEELQDALQHLPADLAAEAADLVDDAAERARAALYQTYPPGPTGALRRGVSLTVNRSTYGIAERLDSRAPHAHLWEWGTRARFTKKGWRRGTMPAKDRLVPIATRERARLVTDLIKLVERAGFRVSP